MTGAERRDAILNRIKNSEKPVAGRSLAEAYDVSRQVIVQDIALIRASGYDIISTNRGYILGRPSAVSRTFKVRHTDEQLEEELYSIVDLGGTVRNVMVNHKVYGQMEARQSTATPTPRCISHPGERRRNLLRISAAENPVR